MICPQCGNENDIEDIAHCQECEGELLTTKAYNKKWDIERLKRPVNLSDIIAWLITAIITGLWLSTGLLYLGMDSGIGPGGLGGFNPGTPVSYAVNKLPYWPLLLLLLSPLQGIEELLVVIITGLFIFMVKKLTLFSVPLYSRNILLASLYFGSSEIVSHFRLSELIEQPVFWSPLNIVINVLDNIPGFLPITNGNFLAKDLILTFSTIGLIYIVLYAIKVLALKLTNDLKISPFGR